MSVLARPLSRGKYLGFGAVLSALKVAVDYEIATYFGHPYSILFYVSPIDAPLFHLAEDRPYWATLALTTVPFAAIGVALTVRRLRDAAMSPGYAALFFAPFANLLFFLTMAIVPSRPHEPAPVLLPPQPVYRASGQPPAAKAPARGKSIWISGALGSVLALAALGTSIGIFGSYGVALLIGTPSVAGFATGAFYARLNPGGKFAEAAAATVLASALSIAALILSAREGAICIMMSMPLFVLPSMIGSFIGFTVFQKAPKRTIDVGVLGAVLLLPLLAIVETVTPLPALTPAPVTTAIVIDAPPERVWPLLTEIADMEKPTSWPFSAGIAYPIRATLDAPRVGAARRCEFSTGMALETVERWDPPHDLVFHIDTQPDPMVEATLWRGPRQPHLDGYVRNVRGEFTLARLEGDRTRVTARSWYTVRISPETYWRAWSDAMIHAIHHRVLDHAKARAEAAVRAPLASTGP